MKLNYYLKLMLAPYLLLTVLIASCSSPINRAGEEHEFESNPNEKDAIPVTSMDKVTGTSFLANIKEIGLFSTAGRVTCMVIDKTNSNHLIAGSATGGLWTSNNRGVTWAPIDDQLPTLNISSLCQNPLQPNTYYASTHTQMLAAPSTTASRPDIYKSTDGGKTFQLLPVTSGAFNLVTKVVCSPINQSTVYALSDMIGSGALYRSQDNGLTFTKVLAVTSNVTDLEILPNGTVLVCAGPQVYRSVTGNNGTFTVAFNGSVGANTFTNIDLAYCEGQPDNIYGVSTGGNSGVGVFKSTNGGLNWSFLQSLATGVNTRTVGVKPNNPAWLFAGSVGLYLSQNSGSSFVFYGVGGVDWWSVNFDPANSDKVFMTFDQGIVEVNLNPFNPNNNTAYVTRDSLFNCSQIYAGDYFVKGDKVIVGMQDLGTSQAYIGGDRGVASGDGGYCYFHKQDTTIAYGSYQNGDILKKTSIQIPFPQPGFTQPLSILNQLDANNDGTVDEGAFFIQPFWVNDADGEQLYYPTKKRLWRSTNGGNNWQPVSGYYTITNQTGSEPFMDGNKKVNPIVYWAVTDTLFIMPNAKTATAGNEIKVKLPGRIRSVRVSPSNDSIVFITAYSSTTGPRIYRSGNLFKGNVQWTDLTGDMPEPIAVRCIEVNPQDANQMVVGTSSGLYVSTNGGQHWDRETKIPNVNILKTALRPSDNRLFIFTYGRGAWATSFPPSTVVKDIEATTALTVWPNPTQGVLHINIPEAYKNNSLRLWSADGKVQKVVTSITSASSQVDISDLPAGNYILGLFQDGKLLKTAKIIRM